jgi:hypothetical protein
MRRGRRCARNPALRQCERAKNAQKASGVDRKAQPAGIHAGDEFNVVIRRVTSRRLGDAGETTDAAGGAVAARGIARAINWRSVVGTFQMQIPVKHDHEILPGEKSLLSVLRWRLQQLTPENRWGTPYSFAGVR